MSAGTKLGSWPEWSAALIAAFSPLTYACVEPDQQCSTAGSPQEHHFDAPVVPSNASPGTPGGCPATEAGSPSVVAGPIADGGKRKATTTPASSHHRVADPKPASLAPPQPLNTQQVTAATFTRPSTPAELLRRKPCIAQNPQHLATVAAPGKVLADCSATCPTVDPEREPFVPPRLLDSAAAFDTVPSLSETKTTFGPKHSVQRLSATSTQGRMEAPTLPLREPDQSTDHGREMLPDSSEPHLCMSTQPSKSGRRRGSKKDDPFGAPGSAPDEAEGVSPTYSAVRERDMESAITMDLGSMAPMSSTLTGKKQKPPPQPPQLAQPASDQLASILSAKKEKKRHHRRHRKESAAEVDEGNLEYTATTALPEGLKPDTVAGAMSLSQMQVAAAPGRQAPTGTRQVSPRTAAMAQRPVFQGATASTSSLLDGTQQAALAPRTPSMSTSFTSSTTAPAAHYPPERPPAGPASVTRPVAGSVDDSSKVTPSDFERQSTGTRAATMALSVSQAPGALQKKDETSTALRELPKQQSELPSADSSTSTTGSTLRTLARQSSAIRQQSFSLARAAAKLALKPNIQDNEEESASEDEEESLSPSTRKAALPPSNLELFPQAQGYSQWQPFPPRAPPATYRYPQLSPQNGGSLWPGAQLLSSQPSAIRPVYNIGAAYGQQPNQAYNYSQAFQNFTAPNVAPVNSTRPDYQPQNPQTVQNFGPRPTMAEVTNTTAVPSQRSLMFEAMNASSVRGGGSTFITAVNPRQQASEVLPDGTSVETGFARTTFLQSRPSEERPLPAKKVIAWSMNKSAPTTASRPPAASTSSMPAQQPVPSTSGRRSSETMMACYCKCHSCAGEGHGYQDGQQGVSLEKLLRHEDGIRWDEQLRERSRLLREERIRQDERLQTRQRLQDQEQLLREERQFRADLERRREADRALERALERESEADARANAAVIQILASTRAQEITRSSGGADQDTQAAAEQEGGASSSEDDAVFGSVSSTLGKPANKASSERHCSDAGIQLPQTPLQLSRTPSRTASLEQLPTACGLKSTRENRVNTASTSDKVSGESEKFDDAKS
ncbi:nascent polypeptide-associated complex subunit alpha, muscle-specific form [Dermacentor silvarum]|uniref:nascent polypeptide-associated complex subunit alpha, muscle-specific form n=1 Tax=Dermacentor silvarum TaxID=543639 RepID=UPI001898E605|nr:nascent polypeptide-associated complex subunit alpha, muscle-specific form [Dermacentor silvarum]